MAKTRTKTKVVNFTRSELLQDTTKRFLDIASDYGGNCSFYYERLQEIIRNELITDFELVVSDGVDPLGGVALVLDWEKHTVMVRADGEFMPADIINEYGSTDSIIDTLELVRNYVSGLAGIKPKYVISIRVWYTPNIQRMRELGEDRFAQLMNRLPSTPDEKQLAALRWAKVSATKADKSKKRVSDLGDLPEASIKAW